MTNNNEAVTERLLTPGQVAACLQIPTSTLSRWRSERCELAYIKVGRVVRYRKSDIDAWIANNTVDPSHK